MGHPKTAALYAKRLMTKKDADGIVLKISVPTSVLKTIFLPPRYTFETPEHEHFNYAESFDDLFDKKAKGQEKFSSREKFKQNCKKIQDINLKNYNQMRRNDDVMRALKSIMFAVTQEVPFSPLPSENAKKYGHPESIAGKCWVSEVWDLQHSSEPEFESIKEYMMSLASSYPKKLPDGIIPADGGFKQEDYKVFGKFVEDMMKKIGAINKQMKDILEAVESGDQKRVSEEVKSYIKLVESLLTEINQLEQRRRKEYHWDPEDTVESYSDYERYFSQDENKKIKSLIEFLTEVRQEEVDKSVDYSRRTSEVLEDVESSLDDALPDLRSLEQKIETS
jgi:flagellar biosynthesis/type III secretory pathway chaperone